MHQQNPDSINLHGLKIPVEDLFSHVGVLSGRPGSGKSRAVIRVLLRELLKLNARDPERRCGMLVIDGKGSELRHYLEEALRLCGREDDLLIIGPRHATFNPLADSSWEEVKIANEIMAAAQFQGGNPTHARRSTDPFWDRASLDVLTALIGLARHLMAKNKESHLTFNHLVNLRPMLTKPDNEIQKMAEKITTEFDVEVGVSFLEYASLPTVTRQSVASSVGPVLAPFGRRPLKDVLNPAPNRTEADLNTIIKEGKIILLDVGEADQSVELLPAAAMVKSCFTRMILARRRRVVNQVRPVFMVLEEFQKIFTVQAESPACEANFMDVCRWAGCGVILSVQGISSLLSVAPAPLVDKLVSLINTQIFLGSSDPAAAAYADRAFSQYSPPTESRPAPLLYPGTNDAKITTPNLATTPPGTMHVLLRDGKAHTVHADLAAP